MAIITKLVKADTAPRVNFTLKMDGAAINLSGATVRFKFRKLGSTSNIFNRTCIIADAPNGKCYYDWQSGDLANTGTHVGEVEVTFADGKVQTCRDVLRFNVRDEL